MGGLSGWGSALFQFSIGDANNNLADALGMINEVSILYWRCQAFCIHPTNSTSMFQFSIGDAPRCGGAALSAAEAVSILYWRCAFEEFARAVVYLLLVSILYWRCALRRRPLPRFQTRVWFQFSIGDA